MKPHHEQLLVAVLVGLIIAGAATFFITPSQITPHSASAVFDVAGGQVELFSPMEPARR